MREDTRERVQAAIDELGFIPDPQARGLAFRRLLPHRIEAELAGLHVGAGDAEAPQFGKNLCHRRGVLGERLGGRAGLGLHPGRDGGEIGRRQNLGRARDGDRTPDIVGQNGRCRKGGATQQEKGGGGRKRAHLGWSSGWFAPDLRRAKIAGNRKFHRNAS